MQHTPIPDGILFENNGQDCGKKTYGWGCVARIRDLQ